MTMTPDAPGAKPASALPANYDSAAVEQRWTEHWRKAGIYKYDPTQGREQTYVVDTPPPTVSGSLHVGHVFSYSQTDFLVRQQRMRGKNIFYPMGWDDNGLPTERRVQNYFHVRVDLSIPYDPALQIEPVADADRKKTPPRRVSRPNFIELCERLTRDDERAFKDLWTRMSLSVDWEEEYATIDRQSRWVAQRSFLELFETKRIYMMDAPIMWDVDFETAVAQAEIEERPVAGSLQNVRFGVEGDDGGILIGTTRPELLPACVGLTVHPEDPRYSRFIGKRAITPVFRVSVPIFASPMVDPAKGTGAVMVCTFGDATDVVWWREQGLALRQILRRDGRLAEVRFGEAGWESGDPEGANRAYAQMVGKTVTSARPIMLELLSAAGALEGQPVPLERAVKFFEKGDRPVEILSARQWFLRLLDIKDDIYRAGEALKWHPPFMATRFLHWTQGLNTDWCVSRQRFFGVPIPVWYPLDDLGRPDYARPIVAPVERLPVDPTAEPPPGYAESQRNQPGGFAGEQDVFDTWFTSSMTPLISSHWKRDEARHARLYPADLRPQSHEIIRTWTFYTVVKGLLHEGALPWSHVAISGWVLDPDRKKMSKSKGNVITPAHLLDKYTADGVRYWSAGARLGTDTAFDEGVLQIGRRLVIKIFNAGKFVLGQGGETAPITSELDRALIGGLRELVEACTASFERMDYSESLARTERFFWSIFTDLYLELVKGRARAGSPAEKGSAIAALRLCLNVLLRLFAPLLPFVTEEVWSWEFAAETGHPSIHRAPWPTLADLSSVEAPASAETLALSQAAFRAVAKHKAAREVSMGRGLKRLVMSAPPAAQRTLAPALGDLRAAARAEVWEWKDAEADAGLEVVESELAEEQKA